MKKIMFNDKYGLTQAVLDDRKTQTRRVIKCPREFKGEWVAGFNIHIRQSDKKVVGAGHVCTMQTNVSLTKEKSCHDTR